MTTDGGGLDTLPPVPFLLSLTLYTLHHYPNNDDTETTNWKTQALPLARIKKIMKSEEVINNELERQRYERKGGEQVPQGMRFMISGDAPLIMEKACEFILREIAIRSWRHTERAKRRTLQRQDIFAGVGESEMFDFLIDIVPHTLPPAPAPQSTSAAAAAPGLPKVEPTAIGQQHQTAGVYQPDTSTVNLSDAQLQELHEHYNILQQRAERSAGIAHDVVDVQSQQPQVVLKPELAIHPPKGSSMPQWQPEPATDETNPEKGDA